MKKLLVIFGFIVFSGCSSTRFVDSWTNREIRLFRPEKMLVIGMTENLTARKIFEDELSEALRQRGLTALESSEVLDQSFTGSQKSEEEIDAMREKLVEEGFDAVIISAVIGIEDKTRYRTGYYSFGYNWWYRFTPYYYRFQGIYYTPDYYEDYKVFHIETSIYNIGEDENKALVWVGTFDIVDPSGISTAIDDYIERIILQLERDGVIERIRTIQ